MTERMKDILGSPGTWSGFYLRSAQCSFAAASVGVMASANSFSNYTAFWYSSFISLLPFTCSFHD
jgi:hypothetical protein